MPGPPAARRFIARSRQCSSEQYSLWRDLRAAALSGTNLTAAAAWQPPAGAQCSSCPAQATCTGGAVVVPKPGFWHSSPQSTLMHRCPNPDACDPRPFSPGSEAAKQSAAAAARFGAQQVNAPLLVCQERWYASLAPGSDVLQQLQQARARLSLSNSTSSGGGSNNIAAVNGSTAAGADVARLEDVCILWPSPDTEGDDHLFYVNRQCAEGYSGRLCATCLPYLYLSNDFEW